MKRAAYAVVASLLLTGSSVAAHHSYEAYDRDQEVTIGGRLEKLVFANPHVMLTVKTPEGEVYTAEWGNVAALGRVGVTKDTLKEGDSIVVLGVPMRDRSLHRLGLVKEIRRPGDGWMWKRAVPPPAAAEAK